MDPKLSGNLKGKKFLSMAKMEIHWIKRDGEIFKPNNDSIWQNYNHESHGGEKFKNMELDATFHFKQCCEKKTAGEGVKVGNVRVKRKATKREITMDEINRNLKREIKELRRLKDERESEMVEVEFVNAV